MFALPFHKNTFSPGSDSAIQGVVQAGAAEKSGGDGGGGEGQAGAGLEGRRALGATLVRWEGGDCSRAGDLTSPLQPFSKN